MKKEDLYNGISGIRPEFLQEAESYKAEKRFTWKKWLATAACLCVVAVGGILLFRKPKPTESFRAYAYEMDSNGELVELAVEVYQRKPDEDEEPNSSKTETVGNPVIVENVPTVPDTEQFEPVQLIPLGLKYSQLPGVHFYMIAIEMDDKEANSTFCGFALAEGMDSKMTQKVWKDFNEMEGISMKGMRYFIVNKEGEDTEEMAFNPKESCAFEFRNADGHSDEYIFLGEEDESGHCYITMRYVRHDAHENRSAIPR